MPKSAIVEIPPQEKAQLLAALRRARYGYLLSLHILLLCAVGRHPTAIADVLFCSRSSVYRTVRAYRVGTLNRSVRDWYTQAAPFACSAAAIFSIATVTPGS